MIIIRNVVKPVKRMPIHVSGKVKALTLFLIIIMFFPIASMTFFVNYFNNTESKAQQEFHYQKINTRSLNNQVVKQLQSGNASGVTQKKYQITGTIKKIKNHRAYLVSEGYAQYVLIPVHQLQKGTLVTVCGNVSQISNHGIVFKPDKYYEDILYRSAPLLLYMLIVYVVLGILAFIFCSSLLKKTK